MTAPSIRPASGQRDRYYAIALAVIATAVAVRMLIAVQGYLAYDDFALIARASASPLDAPFAFTVFNNHLMPGAMALVWAITHTVGLEYWPYVVVMAVGEAILGLAFLRLLRRMLPPGWPVVITLALLLFSPLTIEVTSWWAVGANLLGFQIGMVLALTAQLSYVRTRRKRHLAELAAAVLLGLAFFEKALLIVPLVALFTTCLCVSGGPIRSVLNALRRYAASWVVLALIALGYLSLYLSLSAGTTTARPPRSTDEVLGFLEQIFGSNVAPGLVGGPWRWLDAGDGAPGVAPPTALAWVSWLVLAGLIMATLMRRRGALRAWVMAGGYLGLVVALLGSTRLGGLFSAAAGLAPRYVADFVVVAALAIGVALFGSAPLDDLTDTAPTREADSRLKDRLRAGARLDAGSRAPLLPAISALVFVLGLVGMAWSLGGFADDWSNKFGRDYLRNVRAEFGAAAPDTVLYDRPVPEGMMGGLAYPDNLQSRVFAPLPHKPQFGTVAENLAMLDDYGIIRTIKIDGRKNVPGPDGACGYHVASGPGTRIPLDGALFDWDWVARVAYISSGDTTATIQVGKQAYEFPIRAGLNQMFIALSGLGDTAVLSIADPSVSVCTNEVAVGNPVPDI